MTPTDRAVEAVEAALRRAFEYSAPVTRAGWREDAAEVAAAARVPVVVETLRFLVEDGWVVHDDDRAWMREVLERIDAGVESAACCPLCEETVCDDGCPLRSVRARVMERPEGA